MQNRVIIYCGSGLVDQVKAALKTKYDISSIEYFAKLGSEKRMSALFDFNYQKERVLITTELGSRGFSFLAPIDTIISLDHCSTPEDEAVRIARSNKPTAQYIVVVEEKDPFQENLQKLLEKRHQIDTKKEPNV